MEKDPELYSAHQEEQRAVACTACPQHLVNLEWLPISYFGNICSANAWLISINPSEREFTDRLGNLLTGDSQRFHIVTDFPDCRSRGEAVNNHPEQVFYMQDTIFKRVPYRPYFNRIGRFLADIHCFEHSGDPLVPLISGASQGGKCYLYAHLDVVKCATKQPWSDLKLEDKELLIKNCAIHLENQMRNYPNLELLLINGKTAHNACVALFKQRFGATLETQEMADNSFRFYISWGEVRVGTRSIYSIAWTANIVRQRLKQEQYYLIVESVKKVLALLSNNARA